MTRTLNPAVRLIIISGSGAIFDPLVTRKPSRHGEPISSLSLSLFALTLTLRSLSPIFAVFRGSLLLSDLAALLDVALSAPERQPAVHCPAIPVQPLAAEVPAIARVVEIMVCSPIRVREPNAVKERAVEAEP